VPDVSRQETKLWFYFLAASFIDVGIEAIHFGQIELMNGNDRDLEHYSQILPNYLVRASVQAVSQRMAALRLGLGGTDRSRRPSSDAGQSDDEVAVGPQELVLRQ
jgi:hypothetical protein